MSALNTVLRLMLRSCAMVLADGKHSPFLFDLSHRYKDPFIIESGAVLSVVAKSLSTQNFGKGFSLYIDDDYFTSFDVNFEKWDSDKTNGINHTRFESDGSAFVAVKWNADDTEWIADTAYSSAVPTFTQVGDYLAGAIRMNVDNYEEAVKLQGERSFKSYQNLGAVETSSSTVTIMKSPKRVLHKCFGA